MFSNINPGPGGLIGVTTNERTVSIWTGSHHLCSQLESELLALGEQVKTTNHKHKEKAAGRIKSDSVDREK